MNPLFGFLFYFAACLFVAITATKRGRSGLIFFSFSAIAGFPIVVLANNIAGANVAAVAAFASPAIALAIVLTSKNAEEKAVSEGKFGDFVKCPECAESVRKEAKKCKHCHSTLIPQA